MQILQNLEEIQRYISSQRPDGVIVDTNILLLLLIGNYNSILIKDCSLFKDNRKNYTIEDFELLKTIISYFSNKLIITPQIIAELSNLSITRNKNIFGKDVLLYVRSVVNILKEAKEHHQHSECLWGMDLEVLSKYGFTDMTIYELSKSNKIPVLTDELELHQYLLSSNIPAIRFEYIKNSRAGYTLA